MFQGRFRAAALPANTARAQKTARAQSDRARCELLRHRLGAPFTDRYVNEERPRVWELTLAMRLVVLSNPSQVAVG